MSDVTLLVCRNPGGSHWGLGNLPAPAGRLALIGWRVAPRPEDAGVPGGVAAVLARALTAVARLTFPSSEVEPSAPSNWSPLGEDLVRSLGRGRLARRIAAARAGMPSEVVLRSTRRPEAGIRLFDDAAYPWWQQGQVVLLSEPEESPPDLDQSGLFSLLGGDWKALASLPESSGVLGVLRPGIDGDIAGLLSFSDEFERALLAALERQARSAGFDWFLASEDDFAQHLADGGT